MEKEIKRDQAASMLRKTSESNEISVQVEKTKSLNTHEEKSAGSGASGEKASANYVKYASYGLFAGAALTAIYTSWLLAYSLLVAGTAAFAFGIWLQDRDKQ
ncbi:MAG: hypothetical protein ACP5SA_02925 [Candidatus Micrarchaeia archaeon]